MVIQLEASRHETETQRAVSIVVVSWNTRELLRRCLASLREEIAGIDAEVFVVDNASADGSADMVEEQYPEFRLIRNAENLGFAKANNQAFRLAKGRTVLLLNPDTEIHPGAITTLLEFLETHRKAAIVAPQLLNTDGSIQQSCRAFPTFLGMLYELLGLSKLFPNVQLFREYKMLDFDHDTEREVDQPEGACLLVRREIFEEIGMLDEAYFMLFEEVDWCYRIKKAGWQIWFTPSAKVTHHYGQSIKQVKVRMIVSSHKGLYRFWRKHYCGGRLFLIPIAYFGLMALAILRIVAYKIRHGRNLLVKTN